MGGRALPFPFVAFEGGQGLGVVADVGGVAGEALAVERQGVLLRVS